MNPALSSKTRPSRRLIYRYRNHHSTTCISPSSIFLTRFIRPFTQRYAHTLQSRAARSGKEERGTIKKMSRIEGRCSTTVLARRWAVFGMQVRDVFLQREEGDIYFCSHPAREGHAQVPHLFSLRSPETLPAPDGPGGEGCGGRMDGWS